MHDRRIHRGTAAGMSAVAVALILAACSSSGGGSSSGSGGSSSTLNASGSTLQLPFEQAAIQQFKQTHPNMTVNYGGGGSGKGRTDLASGVVNFAGSDSPIPSDEVSNFKGKKVLYFPILASPITVSYNLSGVKNLQLTPKVIADIFQGKIKKWNDPAIKADNPSAKLPSTAITIAHRSDSSGTTANFSAFLVAAAPNWKLGTSSTINWPANSRGGDGNGGVASIIKSTAGAVGYVDFADAKAAGLTYANVQNKDGKFLAPSSAGASAALSHVSPKSDLTFSSVWEPGATSYPITAPSWVLVYQKQPNASDVKNLKAYIGYLEGAGQSLLPGLGYAKMSSNLDQQAEAQLSQITS